MLPTAIELPVKSLRAEVDTLSFASKDLNEAWSQPTVLSCQATGLQPSLLSPVRGLLFSRVTRLGIEVRCLDWFPASQNECA